MGQSAHYRAKGTIKVKEQTKNTAQIVDALKGLSRSLDREIAAVVGVSQQAFNKALRKARDGEGDLSIEHVARIADAFGVPLHVMFLPYQEALMWIAENKPVLTLDLRDDKGKQRSDWSARNESSVLGRLAHSFLVHPTVTQAIDLR